MVACYASNPLILFQFVSYGVTVSEGRVGFKGGVNKKFFTFFKAYYISKRKQELHRAKESKTELLRAKNCKEGSFHHKTAKIGRRGRETKKEKRVSPSPTRIYRRKQKRLLLTAFIHCIY